MMQYYRMGVIILQDDCGPKGNFRVMPEIHPFGSFFNNPTILLNIAAENSIL